MDKLEELYSIALTCNCFEEAYKRGVYKALRDLLQTWENDDLNSILLALTVVQKLYQRLETVQCTYLKIITDSLVSKNHLVDGLLKYLDHRNQHVVFSAFKAIVLVFQALSKETIKTEWFQTLFNFGKETEKPWRKLYSMEVLNKILKNSRETLKQQNMNQMWSCSHEAASACISTTVSRTELVDLLLGSLNLQHILFYYIPFIVRPNGVYSFLKCSQEVGPAEDFGVLQASLKLGDAVHSQENVKREAISGMKENDLVAFLHCISELAKYFKEVNRTLQNKSIADIKSCSQEENYFPRSRASESKDGYRKSRSESCKGKTDSLCVTEMAIIHVKDATANQLLTVVSTLVQYLHYPRLPSLIFKKILEVLNQVIVIPYSFMFRKEKTKYSELERIVSSSSLSFLSVVQCCLFHKIPRCSGFVGFSGTEVRSPSETVSSKASSADLVALRKASLMVFKSSFVVLQLAKKHEGSLLFQNLSLSCVSKWCSGILSFAPDVCFKSSKESSCESEFHNRLVALFVDQDDDLVEVMLLLLLLFQEIQQSVSCYSEISTTILRQLNPHLLFISFTESVEFDHSFLLDLLISSETRFLEYFVQYLHFVIGGWSSFVQYLEEYKEIIPCSAEEAMNGEVLMCNVSLRDFESDSNSFEKPSEFESCVANEIYSRKNDSFARQETMACEDRQCSELPDTFSWPQNNSSEKCETSHEAYQCESRLLGIPSGGLNGLTSIVLAYSSSDESEVENEDEDKSVNDNKGAAVAQSDSVICGNVCLNNEQLGSLPFSKADSVKTLHSSYTAKSCSGLVQNVSEENNLGNSVFTEHPGISPNHPVVASDLNAENYMYLGHDQRSLTSTKLVPSSDRKTAVFITCTEGNATDPSDVECKLLDKVMTMFIRLRLSVMRLSSGGHFPYSAAPLIVLMENMEKCYDGC